MLSIDCNYQCICQSVWNWWCTAFFYIQRQKRGNKSSWCNEYIIFTGMRQCYSVDDDWTCICTPIACVVWSIWYVYDLRISIYDDISDWYPAVDDCNWNESIYQCAGIFTDRYDFSCYRSIDESDIGSCVYISVWIRRAWRGNRNGSFAVSFSNVCIIFPYEKSRTESAFLT